MNDYERYVKSKINIDINYPSLVKQQEEWIQEHWKSFNSQRTDLEAFVSQEFERVVREIGPLPLPEWILTRKPQVKNAEILGHKTEYNPQFKEFRIKITKLRLPDGKIMNDADVLSSRYGCPHVFLDSICGFGEEVNSKIEEFKKRYSIRSIDEPNNNCEHK